MQIREFPEEILDTLSPRLVVVETLKGVATPLQGVATSFIRPVWDYNGDMTLLQQKSDYSGIVREW